MLTKDQPLIIHSPSDEEPVHETSGSKDQTTPSTERPITGEEVIRNLFAREFGNLIIHDPAARHGRDPEGVHQLRVSARRLRSELKIVKPIMKTSPFKAVQGELRWIGSVLGQERDLDVLRALLKKSSSLTPNGNDAIVSSLDAERKRQRQKVTATLASRRYIRLVETLAHHTAAPPLRSSARECATTILTPNLMILWSDLYEFVNDAGSAPNDNDLHRIRILTKQSRYGAEVARMFNPEISALAPLLARAQDSLGEIHDSVVAIDYLHSHFKISSSTPSVTSSDIDSLISDITQAKHAQQQLWRQPLEEARRLIESLRMRP